MVTSRLLDLRNKLLTTIISQWPLAVVVFGLALTVVWLALLTWVALRLFNVV
jgi:hypothetical protein